VRREAETLASTLEYEVLVLTPKEGKIAHSYELDGVAVKELKVSKYQGKSIVRYFFSYLRFAIKVFQICNRLFFKKRIWAIHAHNIPNFLIFSAIIPYLFGKKIILDIHDSVPETYATKFEKKSGKLINNLILRILCLEESASGRLADRIICVNHPQRETLLARGINPHKILVSMNVPDHKRFRKKARIYKEERPADGFKLVYHGTLARRLGIDLGIEAISKLMDKINGLEFYVVGGGDDQEKFMQLTGNLQVDKLVHFKGPIPLEGLADFLQEMDLGILAYRKHIATDLMLPVKMLEYIALEIPVVVPRLKTIQYYFTEEMVGYFEPENTDSLANIILELYRDGSKRRSQAQAAKGFLERFGWEIHQTEFLNLYRNLYRKC
jgi:glycosyltransferase involved in cell wall biosynthesis